MFRCRRETTERDDGKRFFNYLIAVSLWLPSVCVWVCVCAYAHVCLCDDLHVFPTNKLRTFPVELGGSEEIVLLMLQWKLCITTTTITTTRTTSSSVMFVATPPLSQASDLMVSLTSSYFPASCFTQKQVQPASKIGADPFLLFLYLNCAQCISVRIEYRPWSSEREVNRERRDKIGRKKGRRWTCVQPVETQNHHCANDVSY